MGELDRAGFSSGGYTAAPLRKCIVAGVRHELIDDQIRSRGPDKV
ncbi:MAG: hypothetical protein WCF90_06690 [Methanomicrobiales archaeon]